jgi:hypothetical protein
VTVRRLTSGEYNYSIQDLTGLDLKLDRDLVSDEVGGEGFSNFGDVQFIQDAGMERYLEAAKRVADHAVIGQTYRVLRRSGKTGFELGDRADQDHIRKFGFRPSRAKGDGRMDWISMAKLCMWLGATIIA